MPWEGVNPLSAISFAEFNAQFRNDGVLWKGVISLHGDADVNDNGRLLVQLSCNNALCIINTFFLHRNLHKYTWCRFDFGIVSADLLPSVLDVHVKRGAYLSTDHHLVVCNLRFEKPTEPIHKHTSYKGWDVLPIKLESPG